MTAIMLLLTCCTQVNDNLGMGIVPPNQQVTVKFAQLKNGINTYTTITDSIVTSGMSWVYAGSTTDKKFGRTDISAIAQFFPLYRSDTVDYGAARGQVADSMWILSNFKYVAGDTLVTNKFDVYRVDERLYGDSTYYSGLNYKDYVESLPMFSCEFTGNATGANYDTLRLKVNDKTLAEAFMNELLSLDTLYYTDSTKFVDKFKGLCITPTPTSTTNNTIYKFGLGYSNSDSYFTMLVFYGHDYLTETPDEVEDIIVRSYVVSNNTTYTIGAAMSCFDHDYTGTPIEGQYVYDYEKDWGATRSTTYVQGFLGVTGSLELTDDFVTELKALVPEGGNVFINQALLRVALADISDATLDAAPERFGTYFDYAKLSAIPDYNYYYEKNNSLKLNYDGYLNRSHGYYNMDIAVYLQKLLDGDYTAPYRLTLGMAAYDYLTEGQVALLGTGSATPVTIDLTYTIIGK